MSVNLKHVITHTFFKIELKCSVIFPSITHLNEQEKSGGNI